MALSPLIYFIVVWDLMTAANGMGADFFTFRLHPADDLRLSIEAFAKTNNLRSASIISCAGSLKRLNLRLATNNVSNTTNMLTVDNYFEITSLTGTVAYHQSLDGVDIFDTHLHMSVSDDEGQCLGGHVLNGCTVFTTAEITLVNSHGVTYFRQIDPSTGYKELVVVEDFVEVKESLHTSD